MLKVKSFFFFFSNSAFAIGLGPVLCGHHLHMCAALKQAMVVYVHVTWGCHIGELARFQCQPHPDQGDAITF